jgi:hypothetical protein
MGDKAGWDTFVHTKPREDFNTLSIGELHELLPTERSAYEAARRVWNKNLPVVETPQMNLAFTLLRRAVGSLARDSDNIPTSVVIDASAGVGKTTIAGQFGREFHLERERQIGTTTLAGNQHLPVAFISLLGGTTLKSLNEKILRFYGHPAATRASRSELSSLVVDCVYSCETQLIILDDLHFIDFRHRDGMEVSNHLKGLASETSAAFVLVGVGLEQKLFFDEGLFGPQAAYSQTSRRQIRCPVDPFSLESENSSRAWVDLLKRFEEHLKLANRRSGMLVDHSKQIMKKTSGRLISLMHLLDGVCDLAISTGVETVTAEQIKEVQIDEAAERQERQN